MIDQQAILNEQYQTALVERRTAEERGRPCVIWRPAIMLDGNKWCALYGEDLQNGVAGFGDSPAEAMLAFDKAWVEKLRARPSA